MAFFEKDELQDLYQSAQDESYEWRRDYKEYERLADNGLIEDLDETLPEVNDGTLSSALFKLPKRIVNTELIGRFKSMDADEAWISELANIYWENKIIPQANYKATWHRKWKDAVRKAAIYGSQPIISLLVSDGNGGTKVDIDVPYAQDVRLEPGKVSDLDSDIIFWDVYYTRKQVRDLIEQAKAETKENPQDGYNKWDVKALQAIYDGKQEGEDRPQNEDHEDKDGKTVTKGGIKFCITFQRGVKAPFYMYHKATNSTVREWENPDPTGDIPVKYLYCYQDFNNPYGIGIVKLAGGTQNVLDELRRLHILATQLGIRPPKKIRGAEDEVDEDSLIMAQDQPWYLGQNGDVELVDLGNSVYGQIANTVSMYKTSLLDIVPVGDTSISGTDSGNPNYSKTPAGVKFQEQSLSIDDADFKDNLYAVYEAVAANLINIAFANMQGADIMRLSDDEMRILQSGGLEIPMDELGQPLTNELEVLWDEVRSTFNFEMEAEEDKKQQDEQKQQSLISALELRAADPNFDMAMQMSGYKFNLGEAYYTLMKMITKNDKIVEEVSAEEKEMINQQGMMGGMPPEQLVDQAMQQAPQETVNAVAEGATTPEQAQANMEAVMAEYGVDQNTAAEALMMEEEGSDPQQIIQAIQTKRQNEQPQGVPQ